MPDKKLNLQDYLIHIRILKALENIRPFGPFKHFKLITILRNLKQPNVLTASSIWKYLNEEFEIKKYENKEREKITAMKSSFNSIFDD
ncbi:hypothetical protein NUSPORA_00235 [Nucleospora cyclopteri]